MVRLKANENPGGHSAVITADGAVAGGIEPAGKGIYAVDTGGRMPAIDGLSGNCPRDAWGKVVQKVQGGGVVYQAAVVVIGPYGEDDA